MNTTVFNIALKAVLLALAALLGPLAVMGLGEAGVFVTEKQATSPKEPRKVESAKKIERTASKQKKKLKRLKSLLDNLEKESMNLRNETSELKKQIKPALLKQFDNSTIFSADEFLKKVEEYRETFSHETWIELKRRSPENAVEILVDKINGLSDGVKIRSLCYLIGALANNDNIDEIIDYVYTERNKTIKRYIINSLAREGHPEALPYLREMLVEAKTDRLYLIISIAGADPIEGVDLLINEYNNDNNPDAALLYLSKIDSVEQYDFLFNVAEKQDISDELIIFISEYFVKIGYPDAIGLLEDIVNRENLSTQVRERLNDSIIKLKKAQKQTSNSPK